jgi:hypothetical protein
MTSEEASTDQPLNPYASSSLAEVDERTSLLGPFQQSISGVPRLGILMTIQGVLQLLMGMIAGAYAIMMPRFYQQIQGQMNQPKLTYPAFTGWYSGAMCLLLLILGVVTIVSGMKVIHYRGRKLAIVTLLFGMLTVFTCYCFPTTIALTIYGLIVLLNPTVKLAFECVEQGRSLQGWVTPREALD